MNNLTRKQDVTAVLLGIYVATVLWITVLGRHSKVIDTMGFQPFHTLLDFWTDIQSRGITGNFLGNIALFMPFGILTSIAISQKYWISIMLTGFGLSLTVEVLQHITKRGYFEIDDLILNTLGTVIGYGLYRAITQKKIDDADSI